MNISKEKYQILCKEEFIPLFSQAWWLDAVCGKHGWDVLLFEKGGKIVGSLPYTSHKKFGFLKIGQPQLTQTLGIWIHYPPGQKEHARLTWEKKVMDGIIAHIFQLKPAVFAQNFAHDITNWLPFYWAGFSQTTRYTYLLENVCDIDLVWRGMEPRVRSDIRKAEHHLSITRDLSLNDFYKINVLTFERQKIRCPYNFELLKRIDAACLKQSCRTIYGAVDSDGNLYAAAYVLWDLKTTYYLLGGTDYRLYSDELLASRGRGALAYCLWHAILDTKARSQRFDFEGSMIQSIEKFCRGFGAVQKPYFQIFKHSPIVEFIQTMRHTFRSLF